MLKAPKSEIDRWMLIVTAIAASAGVVGSFAAAVAAGWAIKSTRDISAAADRSDLAAARSEKVARKSLVITQNAADAQMITLFRREYFQIIHDALPSTKAGGQDDATVTGKEEEARRRRYLHELWGLIYNEFYVFKEGNVEPQLFITWLDVMRRHYAKGVDYPLAITVPQEKDAWTEESAEIGDPEFLAFIRHVLDCNGREDIEKLGLIQTVEQMNLLSDPQH